jgi:putative serine protease PepD
MAVVIGLILGGAIIALVGRGYIGSVAPPAPPQAVAPPVAAPIFGSPSQAPAVGDSDATVQVYERVSPAVVNITFRATQRDVFGRPSSLEGTGSGFIIDNQGHVVTNRHVISSATRLDITLADNTSYVGEVVAADPANDLAVVKLQAPEQVLRGLTTTPLGDSDALKVGQTVVAIGNPFGLERSASLGIVSSLGRTRPGESQRLITNMIQTDAAINPGNSGGPLLNLRGEVIGINEQIEASAGRGNVGVGFAIPANTLKRYLPDLLAGKQPQHAWIGIAGAPVTPTLAEQLRLATTQGVILATAVPSGPAARAGLRGANRGDPASGDIITELDGRPVRSIEDVASYIDKKEPGDTVHATYVRGGRTETVDVTLGVWSESDIPVR